MDAVFAPASADAAIIAQMAWILTAGAALIFGGVMLLVWLGVRRGRDDSQSGRPGRAVRPAVWLVGGGLLLPISVLSALMAYNVRRSAQLETQTSHGALAISVTAKMWWWEVRYRSPSGGDDVVLANELHLPAGRPVYLALTSSDVIHSFWLPALAGKMDMVPGRMTGLTLRPVKPGVYRGQCAEYCGIQHANMALHAVVEAPEAFDAWLARQAGPASVSAAPTAVPASALPAAATLAQGRAAFARHCAACHTVRGVSRAAAAQGAAGPAPAPGPDLTHVASRHYIGAGTLRMQPGAMAAWIANPHAHKPGVYMPAATAMDGATLQALAAWLEHLQ